MIRNDVTIDNMGIIVSVDQQTTPKIITSSILDSVIVSTTSKRNLSLAPY